MRLRLYWLLSCLAFIAVIVYAFPLGRALLSKKRSFDVQWNLNSTQKKGECLTVKFSQLESFKRTPINKIPLIMHRIYLNDDSTNAAEQFITLMNGCRDINNDIIHVIWTKRITEEFIRKKYPEYWSLYKRYRSLVEKADFARVLVLYHFGGVYMDMDYKCYKRISEHLDTYNAGLMIGQEHKLHARLLYNLPSFITNSFMAARKRHPFLKLFFDQFPHHIQERDLLDRTGPNLLRSTLNKYNKQERMRHDRVAIAEPFTFSPLVDPILFPRFNKTCTGNYKRLGKIREVGCHEWDRIGRKQTDEGLIMKLSYTAHVWHHLVYASFHYRIKRRQKICSVRNIYKPIL